jgi:hypothetical protein
LWSRKWRERWKRNGDEEVVLTVHQAVFSESKKKIQCAQRRPRRRMGRRSRRWRGSGGGAVVL